MNFYIRELPQKQYHYQSYDHPVSPKIMKSNQMMNGIASGQIITSTKLNIQKGELKVYAIKTLLNKPRKNTYYKERK